ncbi:MAG: hypothetical protein GTO02_20620, partial [Candidatus Dadabacteria bacterium]|nr:hypothetical protein [Candidatus Dadabacteria bacterium]
LIAIVEAWGEEWQSKGLGRQRKGDIDPWERVDVNWLLSVMDSTAGFEPARRGS